MAEVKQSCSVTLLPTAVVNPVINEKRRGGRPRNVIPIWRLRNARRSREMQAEIDHAARLHTGMLVKISNRDSKNFGRLCHIVLSHGDGWWLLEPLMGQLLTNEGPSNTASVESRWIEPQMTLRR